jgi:hypothetical protein
LTLLTTSRQTGDESPSKVQAGAWEEAGSMKGFLRDNGLSLVLIALFVLFFAGQAVFGWLNYNDEQDEHYQPQIGFVQYVATGAFGEAVFENWESEFLQMSLYVVLTAFLFQRGSSESKDPDKKEEVDENAASKAERSDVPLPVKKGGLVLMLYNHSLSLAFILLFAISFIGHAVCGAQAHNEEALEHGRNALSVWQYLGTSQFWFESLQNWHSEFLAIFAIVVLSIWLREKGSPESKPVAAAHSETGG